MKLYKAKATVTVYFMSDKDTHHRLAMDAEDHIRDSIRHNGIETPTVTEVKGQERIEGDWEAEDFVYGSEDLTGDEPMGLKTAMILMEKAAEKARALPAAGKAAK
jgi:hypothetical protein